jgi:translation initiation factor 1
MIMGRKNNKISGIVYSTDPDFKYEYEREQQPETLPPARQNLLIYLDKQQRAGKMVTVIENFKGKNEDLELLAKLLRNKCSTGGSVKNGTILLQGDFRQKAAHWLTEWGYRNKWR